MYSDQPRFLDESYPARQYAKRERFRVYDAIRWIFASALLDRTQSVGIFNRAWAIGYVQERRVGPQVDHSPPHKESLERSPDPQVSVIARYVDSRGLFEQYTRRCRKKPQERQYPIRPIWQES